MFSCLVWRLTQPYIHSILKCRILQTLNEQHLGVGKHLMASLKSVGKAFSVCSFL